MTQQTIPHPSPDLFNRGPLRRRWARGILVGLVVAFVVLLVWYANLFVQLRLSLTDLLYIQQPTTDTIVLVAIDDDTLQAYGSLLGWDRTRYADALNTLVDAEARVVAFDVLFAEPRDGDDAFAAALADANAAGTRTILAASGIERQPIPERPVIAFRRELAPVAPLAQNDTHIAYVNAYPDADGTIRAAISQGITGGEVGQTERLSFALATYLAYFRISPALAPQVITTDTDQITLPPDVRIPIDERGMWYHNFYGVTRVDGTFQTDRKSVV
jgi:CHASE2 domain-containing sensor protein